MPSLKDIRRRISSVKNTQKITRAMKLVSAAKFARANTAVVSARPYGSSFDAMVRKIVGAAEDLQSPLTEIKPEKKILVVLLGTDRGFCGSLNANLFKAAAGFIREKKAAGIETDVVAWGKRSKLFCAKLSNKLVSSREKVLEKPNYELARELAEEVTATYLTGYDRVYVAYVEFKSALAQSPTVAQLLPVAASTSGASGVQGAPMLIVEPKIAEMFETLVKRKVASQVFRCLLEGAASEHGARMTAMDSATNNAQEVLKSMKIQYNRARQAAITKELIEITSGAEAL